MSTQPPASPEGMFDITVGPDGRVSYSLKENTPLWKRVAAAFGQTAGEAITPTLSPVGGEDLNAQDYILRNYLANQGGESIPEALVKGAGEGVVRTFVPRSSVDLQAEAAGLGGGALLEGARGARAATKAGQAAARSGALEKLQTRARAGTPTHAGTPGGPGGNPRVGPGYHTARRIKKAQVAKGHGDVGPRYNEQTIKLREAARADRSRKMPFGEDKLGPLRDPDSPVVTRGDLRKFEEVDDAYSAMRKGQLEEGTQKMYNEQAAEGLNQAFKEPKSVPEFGDAGDVALDSATEFVDYDRLLDQNPGAGAGRPTFVGPQSSWAGDVYSKFRRYLSPEEFTKFTGLGPRS